jgi:acetylornithine deacetylase/succinyl-diaminopimelate desuccinylase-like protein
LAAEAIRRLAEPVPARLTPVTARFLAGAAAAAGGDVARILGALSKPDGPAASTALAALCSPVYARALDAILRDTMSPDVLHAGVKYNVIPGEAVLEVDCRTLPGTSQADVEARIRDYLGPDLASVTEIELEIATEAVVADPDHPAGLYPILESVIREHDPDGVPLPVMAPFSTDAKHLVALGVPTYGFSPLRQDPRETYLDRYHGVDERVSLEGLHWGLAVLYDAVRRFCG